MNQRKPWRLIAGVGLALTSVLFVLLLLSQNTADATRDRPNETCDIILTPGHSVPHPGAGTRAGASAVPYTVFTPVDITSTNLLTNPGFEDDPPGTGWVQYGSGYTIDETIAHSFARSLKLVNDLTTDTHGASQTFVLSQTEPRPIYFSGWSKAECVSGNRLR